MANNRLALINTWCNLITQEINYYTAAAEHLLCKEGVIQPTKSQLQKKINFLLHVNLASSSFLAKCQVLFTNGFIFKDCLKN